MDYMERGSHTLGVYPIQYIYLTHGNSKCEARRINRYKSNSNRVVSNLEEWHVGTKRKSHKQGLTIYIALRIFKKWKQLSQIHIQEMNLTYLFHKFGVNSLSFNEGISNFLSSAKEFLFCPSLHSGKVCPCNSETPCIHIYSMTQKVVYPILTNFNEFSTN